MMQTLWEAVYSYFKKLKKGSLVLVCSGVGVGVGDRLVRPAIDVHLLTNVNDLGLLFLLGPLTGGYSLRRTLGCPPNRQLWGPSDVGTRFLLCQVLNF